VINKSSNYDEANSPKFPPDTGSNLFVQDGYLQEVVAEYNMVQILETWMPVNKNTSVMFVGVKTCLHTWVRIPRTCLVVVEDDVV